MPRIGIPFLFILFPACASPRSAASMYWQGRIDEAAWMTDHLDHSELASNDIKCIVRAHQCSLQMRKLYGTKPNTPEQN